METLFVSRHPGAIEWARRRGIVVDQMIAQFVPDGDAYIVIGTLPIHLVAQVCEAGGRYLHLEMTLPAEARGKDLTADQMDSFGATLREYRVARLMSEPEVL